MPDVARAWASLKRGAMARHPESRAGSRRAGLLLGRGVALLDVVVENFEELGDDAVALEGQLEGAVHEHGRLGLLEGAGERDADIGVLALAGTVDHAAHHRHLELFHTRVLP